MVITYIGHSGFMAELESCYLIFDYYYGDLPELNREKLTVVFSSHSHQDHYNPQIFDILKGQKRVTAVLSKDIFQSRVPKDIACRFVKPGERFMLPEGIEIETFRSTDRGVAFLVAADGKVLYHAGDLNDWIWDEDTLQEQKTMTGMYRKEIDKMKGRNIDIAFLPLDGRQGQFYDRGMAYFMREIHPKRAVPMHFWDRSEVIGDFKKAYPQYADAVFGMTESGQNCIVK